MSSKNSRSGEQPQEKTKDKILSVAKSLFLQKGFSGCSIRDISQQASVPISLIYHYYKNKTDLWKAVKEYLLEQHHTNLSQENLNRQAQDFSSFREFLSYAILIRFSFYEQNPNIVRLISWQRMEEAEDELSGVQNTPSSTILLDLSESIKYFQEKGEVRKDLSPEILSYFILSSSSSPFFDLPKFINGPEATTKKEMYMNMLIDCFYQYCSNGMSSN